MPRKYVWLAEDGAYVVRILLAWTEPARSSGAPMLWCDVEVLDEDADPERAQLPIWMTMDRARVAFYSAGYRDGDLDGHETLGSEELSMLVGRTAYANIYTTNYGRHHSQGVFITKERYDALVAKGERRRPRDCQPLEPRRDDLELVVEEPLPNGWSLLARKERNMGIMVNTKGIANFEVKEIRTDNDVLEEDGEYEARVQRAEVAQAKHRTMLYLVLQVQDADARPKGATLLSSFPIDAPGAEGAGFQPNLGRLLHSLGRSKEALEKLAAEGPISSELIIKMLKDSTVYVTLTREVLNGIGPRMRVEWVTKGYYNLFKADGAHRRPPRAALKVATDFVGDAI